MQVFEFIKTTYCILKEALSIIKNVQNKEKIKTFLVILVVGLFLNGCCSYKTIQHCVNNCVEREMMRGKPRSYGLTVCPAECKFQICIPF